MKSRYTLLTLLLYAPFAIGGIPASENTQTCCSAAKKGQRKARKKSPQAHGLKVLLPEEIQSNQTAANTLHNTFRAATPLAQRPALRIRKRDTEKPLSPAEQRRRALFVQRLIIQSVNEPL